jgi:hypothetical protein
MANQDGKTESDRAPYSFAEIRFGCKTMRLVIESVTNRLSAEAINCEAVSHALNRMLSWTGKEEAARTLAELLDNDDPATRAHAASAIVALRQVRETPDELRDAFTTEILKACEDPDARVREYAIRTLGWYASSDPETARKAIDLIVQAIMGETEILRLAALDVITDFGVDRVSSKLTELVDCLNDPKSHQVRRRVCEVLGWLEKDAIDVLASLFKCAATDKDDGVRVAAALAIVKIDPVGKYVALLGDGELRSGLLETLRDSGAAGRALRRRLHRRWSNDSRSPRHTERAIAKFPNPGNLRWEDVTIELVSNEEIKILAGGKSKLFRFNEIGFKDQRTANSPDHLWGLLQLLAKENGRIDWQSKTGEVKKLGLKAGIKRLRQQLKAIMQINDDPFHGYRQRKAYETKFQTVDKRPPISPESTDGFCAATGR